MTGMPQNSGQEVMVGSWSDLEKLERGLTRFKDSAQQSIGRIEYGSRQVEFLLEEKRRAAEAAVDEARAAYETCDPEEDDVDAYLRALQNAERELTETRSRNSQFRQSHEAIQARFAKFRTILTDTIPAGSHFLRQKLELLKQGQEIPFDVERGAPSPGSSALHVQPLPSVTCPGTTFGPDGFGTCPLPRGFVWIPLGDIDLEQELREVQTPATFQKIPYETMRRGLEIFRTEILPWVRDKLTNNLSEHFGRMDRDSGASYENGLQRIYEAFFGQHDYIYLVRGRNQLKFTVQNGRHRIKAAQDLGWPAVPVQVKDLRQDSHG